jgi:uncharacterized protein YggE
MNEENNQGCCHLGDCCCGDPKSPLTWLGSILILVLIVAGVFLIRNWNKSYDYIGKGDIRDTISLDGEGKVTAIPDIATFTVGVQTQKKQVTEAQKENTEKMNKIVAALKDLGVKGEDIKTTDYNIYPQYEWPDGRQILQGYQVTQNVLVKVRDLTKVGDLFAKAGELGANNVGNLTFTIDEPEKYRQEARIKAIANAKEKAEALAEATGIKLGKIISFSESNNYPLPMYNSYNKVMGMGGGSETAMPSPDIQSGNQEVVVNVFVSYEVL